MVSAGQSADKPQDADLGTAVEEELSEEDQQLKSELDMIVERLTVGYLKLESNCAYFVGVC